MSQTIPDQEIAADQPISDLIENAPNWLLRSGIGTLAIVVVLLVGLTAFIRYPDKVSGTGIITTEVPPIALVATEGGRIEQLFVLHNDSVRENDPILFIANDASLQDVNRLRELLQQLGANPNGVDAAAENPPELQKLGLMQASYGQLQQQCAALTLLLVQSEIQDLQQSVRSQKINKIAQLNGSLTKEKALLQQELELKQKDQQRQESLYQGEHISAQDYEQNKSTFLQTQRQYEGMESGIINNQIRIKQLEMERAQLAAEYQQQLQALHIEIQQIRGQLTAELQVWEQRYFVKAKTSGAIALGKDIETNAFLPANSTVAYLMPMQAGQMLSRINVPVYSSGKVEKGQKMLLKIAAYPYKEYGILTTEITEVAAIAMESKAGQEYYEIRGNLNGPLISSYGKQLPYKPNMQVVAEIISEDKSLFERIFSQFINLLQNH